MGSWFLPQWYIRVGNAIIDDVITDRHTDSGRRLPSENESRKSGNNCLLLKVLHDSLYLLHHFLRKPVTALLSIKQTYRMVTKKYNVWYCSSLKRHILIKAFSIFLLPVPCQHVQCYSHACCKWHLSFAGQNANFSKSFLIPVPMCDGRLWILLAVGAAFVTSPLLCFANQV